MRFLCLLLLLFFWVESPTFAQKINPFPGIIGSDDREILEETNPAFNAIGRVNFAGYRSKNLCTGTLIAPNKVVTAAHCVINRRTGTPHNGAPIHFLAGYRKGAFKGHSVVTNISFLPGFSHTLKGKAFLEKDVALLTLKDKLEIPPLALSKLADNLPLSHVSYGRDRPHLPVIDRTCHSLKRFEKLWLTDCDTNFGGSGGPVLQKIDGNLKVVAIMVAVSNRRFSIALPSAVWQDLGTMPQ